MITISASNPNALLAAIKKAIDDREVQTWTYDSDGDFTHSAQQWNNQAWLRPSVQAGALTMNIMPPQAKNISSEVYAVYHGRFVEMVLAHFDSRFTAASATALPAVTDRVAA